MGVAASLPRRGERRRARLTVFSRLGAMHGLVSIVAASFLARAAGALTKATPDYFPDEYMYAELGRSLAETGRPLVRGADSSFPALLQPLLTAPAWALGDVSDSYRLIQLVGALAMSLAAVPVFFLAVRLGLTRGTALACAVFAVVIPALLYTSSVLAEPFAYPLFLAAVYSGTIALADRSRRAGIAFAVVAALAAFARLQLAVLPLCFVASALVVGSRRRSLAHDLRAHAIPLLLFAGPVALLLTSPHATGVYGGFLNLELEPLPLIERLGTNGLGLMYAAGWILVPGACLGIALGLTRPSTRAELSLAALSLTLVVALLLQASLYGDLDRIQERYTFYAAPLLAITFCLYAKQGWPWRKAHAVLAAAALATAAVVPLSGYVASYGKVQSPFLLGVARLEEALGEPGTASLAVAVAAALLSLAAIGASLRRRIGSAIALGLALGFCAAASICATLYDAGNSNAVREAYLPEEPSWIDRSGLSNVALVAGFATHAETGAQLFWNRSVEDVLLLPGVAPPDAFGTTPARIGPDGSLSVAGRVVRRPLLVDEWASLVQLRGARPIDSAPSYRLWKPAGTPRLALRFDGYFRDGWLAPRGRVIVWPAPAGSALQGVLSFAVTAGNDLGGPARLRIVAGTEVGEWQVPEGASQRIEVAVCARGPWRARYEVDRATWFDQRFVSFRATPPRFRPEARACS
jgi:hypothetical protein